MTRLGSAVSAAAVVLSLGFATAAFAQKSGGRTDGPEGSEVGYGGYTSPSEGRFSLQLDWGASLQEQAPLSGPANVPLFVGATASYWVYDLFALEASGQYLLNNGRANILVGPKFRTGFWPIGLYAGLKSGVIVLPQMGPRFGISPEIGADMLLKRKVLVGLGYAADIAFGGDGVNHRVFMNIGYRF